MSAYTRPEWQKALWRGCTTMRQILLKRATMRERKRKEEGVERGCERMREREGSEGK